MKRKRHAHSKLGSRDNVSPVATVLLMKWAWGLLSAPDIQEIAHAIKLSGNKESEIDDIASCGAHGTQQGNIHRDLMTRFCDGMETPEPRSYRIPFVESTAGEKHTFFTDVSMYLPSDWFHALAKSDSLEDEFDAIFGLSQLEKFWSMQSKRNPALQNHPVWKRADYRKKAIPIFFSWGWCFISI
eukprot:9491713-Pyramimonas_sp.AAC.1